MISYGPMQTIPLSSVISNPIASPAGANEDLSCAIILIFGLSRSLATSRTLLAVACISIEPSSLYVDLLPLLFAIYEAFDISIKDIDVEPGIFFSNKNLVQFLKDW